MKIWLASDHLGAGLLYGACAALMAACEGVSPAGMGPDGAVAADSSGAADAAQFDGRDGGPVLLDAAVGAQGAGAQPDSGGVVPSPDAAVPPLPVLDASLPFSDAAAGPSHEELRIPVEGGELSATIWRPRVSSGATAVMAHGLGLLASAGLAPFISRFNEAGLTVLTFDYRHFGASTGMPRQLVDPESQLADWRAAITAARTAPTKLVLWGTSFSGGHVLSVSATQAGIAAVIAQVPHVNGAASTEAASTGDVVTLATLAVLDATSGSDTSDVTVPFVGAPGEAALMTQTGAREAYLALVAPGSSWTNETPARSVLGIQAYSPDAVVRTETAPVLMVVATADTVTPPAPARALAERIGARVLELDGGHFDVYTGARFERVVAEEVAFLRSLGLTVDP